MREACSRYEASRGLGMIDRREQPPHGCARIHGIIVDHMCATVPLDQRLHWHTRTDRGVREIEDRIDAPQEPKVRLLNSCDTADGCLVQLDQTGRRSSRHFHLMLQPMLAV